MKKSLIMKNLENLIKKFTIANAKADTTYARRPYPFNGYLAMDFFELKYGRKAVVTNPDCVAIYRECGFHVEETFIDERGIQYYNVTIPKEA